MSILFYRRPDYMAPPSGPVNVSDCARYVERAKGTERAIPPGLSFEEILSNKPLPPCSLTDFMDYLVYIEHNAENLQFYLWYQDYERRFNALPEKNRFLSPEWHPDQKEPPKLPSNARNKEVRTSKRPSMMATSKIFEGMETSFLSEDQDGKNVKPDGSSFVSSLQGSVITSASETNTQAGLKWQPFTIQPFREECTHIIQHYLAPSSPRELNMSHKDRHAILHALQHTTHPSAFAPAYITSSAVLRGQSHPNFIRWSICNGNKPRVLALRISAVIGVLISFTVATLLTLSHQARWWRIFAAISLFLGITSLVAAYKGVCIVMYITHSRNLRPWEESDSDAETIAGQRNSGESIARTMQLSERVGGFDDKDTDRGSGTERASFEQTQEPEALSRWRPSSLQTFGPGNDTWELESWVDRYKRRPLFRKVFEREVFTQDATLRMLQDKIVYGAAIWSTGITICLTCGLVALPSANLY